MVGKSGRVLSRVIDRCLCRVVLISGLRRMESRYLIRIWHFRTLGVSRYLLSIDEALSRVLSVLVYDPGSEYHRKYLLYS